MRFLALILALPAAQAAALAQSLLPLDLYPRAAAMGGAAVASDQPSLGALRHQPAGLAGLAGYSQSFAYLNSFGDWQHHWLAAGFPTSVGVLALEYTGSGMRPITWYDELGNAGGLLEAQSQALGLNWAGRPLPGFSAGGTLRGFSSELGGYKSSGFSFDLGALWKSSGALSLGLALQHLGRQGAFYREEEPMPSLGRMGMGLDLPSPGGRIRIQAEALLPLSDALYQQWRSGVEAAFGAFAARAGAVLERGVLRASFGAGARTGMLQLDYAFSPEPLLGGSHRFGLTFSQ